MLLAEWKLEEAKQVWYEEGMERGVEKGMKNVAINALARGYSVEQVYELTGLDTRTITELSSSV